jgi:putative flippase GtrA
MNLIINRQERNRFLRFFIVGILGAVVDFGVMNSLTHLLNMRLVFAGSISFLCAIISNFLWNRFWTYPDSRSRPLANQLGMFFMVNLVGAAIRIPILFYLEPVLAEILKRIPMAMNISPEIIAKNGVLSLAMIIVMLWNFFVNRYWTYNDIQ